MSGTTASGIPWVYRDGRQVVYLEETERVVAAARAEGEQAEREALRLAEALRLTEEYLRPSGVLPPIEGWSWFDALEAYHAAHPDYPPSWRPEYVSPYAAEIEEANLAALRSIATECPHGAPLREDDSGERWVFCTVCYKPKTRPAEAISPGEATPDLDFRSGASGRGSGASPGVKELGRQPWWSYHISTAWVDPHKAKTWVDLRSVAKEEEQ